MKFPALVVVCFAAVFSESIEAAQKPNILFIYTDNHSCRTLSCYERTEPRARTPKLDRLAARGVRFTHAYIGTWCMPSRVTMLTGLHQYGAKTMRMEGEYPGSEYDPEQCRGFESGEVSRCYLNRATVEFSRRLRYGLRRCLQAIAGLPQGHDGPRGTSNP